MRKKLITGIAAVVESSRGLGIGVNGGLPWKSLPSDMAHFKAVTLGSGRSAVVMGRSTWESIPERFRPLEKRLNVVLSSSPETLDVPAGVLAFSSLPDAIQALERVGNCDHIYVIGGAKVFKDAIDQGYCDKLVITHVQGPEAELCDAFFPPLTGWACASQSDEVTDERTGYKLRFCEYAPQHQIAQQNDDSPTPRHPEHQYLDLIRRIIATADHRDDRTHVGTVAIFGTQMRFDLRTSFPLLTTKKVFFRGVVEELLWFLRGCTDSNELKKRNIHIWDENGSRSFLDNLGFTDRKEGDLGPVYGFQWRHFGAKYIDAYSDYTGQGIDQLKLCIEQIRTNPNSRRIVMSAWNPVDIPKMALPPCHILCQFFVSHGELSCHMYQRSGDMGLGVPFNIASYALLTCMVAKVCNLKPGDFVHTIGDTHVYNTHIEALREQLTREPKPFPTLRINTNKTDIDSITAEEIVLEGYEHHPTIKMQMAV
eukprot:c12607_g1_i1.p1 GENE.c12607_g1_i1~~c12607_g1_i1.p1  ORF type:complete len:482 (+),score=87.60 c12607_g1_i1:59-1504(+)